MGDVIESWPSAKDAVRMSVVIDKGEAVQLAGNLSSIIMFSGSACTHDAEVVRFGGTAYFRMPPSLVARARRASRDRAGSCKARCLRIDAGDKAFIIYIIEKGREPARDRREGPAPALSLLRAGQFLWWH